MASLRTPHDAFALLTQLGAVPWLVRHHELVVEAAALLCDGIDARLEMPYDRALVLLGAALHDAGKIVVPAEMHEQGHRHEEAGRRLLEEHGVAAELSRFCVTHAAWDAHYCTIDDLLVALADKLWKGKRDEALEKRVLEEITRSIGRPGWELFDALDALCEAIAANGPQRLARSNV